MGLDMIVWGLVVLTIAVVLSKIVYIVPQGYEFTRERLGQFVGIMSPGIHFLVPFVDRVGLKQSLMEVVVEIPPQHVISADNATIKIDAICYLQVIDTKKASYEVEDPIEAISQLASTSLRGVLGAMALDEILRDREGINSKVMTALDGATSPWGVKVTRAELRTCEPDPELLAAMSAQMKAERFKRATILEAEGIREAAVAKAEGDKKANVLRAEGESQAAILNAEGQKQATILNAEAREREAEAEATATRVVSEAIASGDDKALQYFLGQKYVENFGRLADSDNSKMVIVPAELTSLVSSLGGMAKLLNKN